MISLARFLATGFGIGYIPIAPGTIASLLAFLLFPLFQPVPASYAFFSLMVLFGASVYFIQIALPLFEEKDPPAVVLDEINAMLFVLFMLSPSLASWILGFILFRLFDIIKPPPIRMVERLPGGWGIMIDDGVAAVYTVVAVWLIQGSMR